MADKQTKFSIVIDAQNKSTASFQALKKQLDATKISVTGVSSAMKTVGTVGAAALTGLTAFIAGSVRSYGEAQLAIAKVDATLKAMGRSADGTKDRILEASQAVIRLGFDDEAAAVSITKLFQVTGDLNRAMELNSLAMDLARNKNIGLEEAARMVTLVLSGNARALKEYGITLDETKTPLEAIAELQGMLSGQAEAATKSVNVQMQVLNETFSNLRDELGERLAPMLTEVLQRVTPLIEKFTQWIDQNPELAKRVLITASAILLLMAVMLPLGMALPGLVLLFHGLSTAILAIGTAINIIGLPTMGLLSLLLVVGYTAAKIANQWQDAWDLIVITVGESANFLQTFLESVINFYIDGINSLIEKVNSLLKKLSDLPLIGSKFKNLKVPTLERVAFERYDTGAVYNEMMNRPVAPSLAETAINISGNVFLDQDTAEHIGDLMMQKLKTSNAI